LWTSENEEKGEWEAEMGALRNNGKQMFRWWLLGSQLAWTPVAAMALCGGIGYWIDQKTGRAPMFMVTGLLVGVVTGIYELFRMVAFMERLNARGKGKER